QRSQELSKVTEGWRSGYHLGGVVGGPAPPPSEGCRPMACRKTRKERSCCGRRLLRFRFFSRTWFLGRSQQGMQFLRIGVGLGLVCNNDVRRPHVPSIIGRIVLVLCP